MLIFICFASLFLPSGGLGRGRTWDWTKPKKLDEMVTFVKYNIIWVWRERHTHDYRLQITVFLRAIHLSVVLLLNTLYL